MCEFTVYLNGEKVMQDVIFARADDKGVVVKDVMGSSKSFRGGRIVEVNVVSTRLVIEG
jgi:predicted RNA-binding protein